MLEQEQERKDMQEAYYHGGDQPPEGEGEGENEDVKFREYINLGDLMSARRAQDQSQNVESFEREALESSPLGKFSQI